MSPTKKTARKTTKKKSAKAARPAARKKTASKKASPKKAARKTASKKAAKKAAPKKAAKKKAAPKKAAPKKAAPKKAAAKDSKKAAPKKAAAPKKKAGKASKKAAPKGRARIVVPDIVKPGLGGKWECFECGAKFYDLGKPDPICPKCGADQRDKPRERSAPAPAERTRRPAVAPMTRLLDEEDAPAPVEDGEEKELGSLEDADFGGESRDDDDDVDVRVIED